MAKRPFFKNGLPGVLAQAPIVASTFGKWPGFILIVASMLVLLMLGLASILVPWLVLAVSTH